VSFPQNIQRNFHCIAPLGIDEKKIDFWVKNTDEKEHLEKISETFSFFTADLLTAHSFNSKNTEVKIKTVNLSTSEIATKDLVNAVFSNLESTPTGTLEQDKIIYSQKNLHHFQGGK